ncbi:hypothetical protein BC830DRAFT_1152250 [Chytriomyces sp. MP71]|nr:hypothetical protein BC830DRAFT_1152250 [Chytriomyces sp. MP71]
MMDDDKLWIGTRNGSADTIVVAADADKDSEFEADAATLGAFSIVSSECEESDFNASKNEDDVGATTEVPRFASGAAIAAHALNGGLRSWILAFGLRGGVSLLLSLLKVAKGRESLRTALSKCLEATVFRFANMVGAFAFAWKLLGNYARLHCLNRNDGKLSPWQQRLIPFGAGFAAGLAVLFESYENRVAVMQQFGVRALQASYNGLKSRNLFSFAHGDTLLFSLACGSIMYAYVMQPDTIPKEYNNWIIQTARVSRESLALSRQNNRRIEVPAKHAPVSFDAIYDCVNQQGGPNALTALQHTSDYYARALREDGTVPVVPCSVIHPTDCNCATYNAALAWKVLRGIAPVYATLNFVPMLLLKTRALLADPVGLVGKGVRNTLVSSAFLSVYVVVYMIGICAVRGLIVRGVLKQDHKGWYYVLGCLASGTSILCEKKARRAELAMYVLPKGLQSLFMVMQRRKLVRHLPGSETFLSCLSFGVLMSFYQVEPEALSPLLVRIMDKVVGRF